MKKHIKKLQKGGAKREHVHEQSELRIVKHQRYQRKYCWEPFQSISCSAPWQKTGRFSYQKKTYSFKIAIFFFGCETKLGLRICPSGKTRAQVNWRVLNDEMSGKVAFWSGKVAFWSGKVASLKNDDFCENSKNLYLGYFVQSEFNSSCSPI